MCTAVFFGWDPAAQPPTFPPTRNWAHIRGRYWSAKIDDISLLPSGLWSIWWTLIVQSQGIYVFIQMYLQVYLFISSRPTFWRMGKKGWCQSTVLIHKRWTLRTTSASQNEASCAVSAMFTVACIKTVCLSVCLSVSHESYTLTAMILSCLGIIIYSGND